MSAKIEYDPFSPESQRDPFPIYERLRREAPVYWAEPSQMWAVSRYDDVLAVLKDTERFSADAVGIVQVGAEARIEGNVVTYDPPDHTRLRTILNRGFTPRRVEEWRREAEQLVAEAVGAMREQEEFDVIGDLAATIPATMIAKILGLPEERHADFKGWTDTTTAMMSGSKRGVDVVESGVLEAALQMRACLAEVLEARRAHPEDDLMSVLVAAQADGSLSEEEALGFAGVLTFAGSETTTNLIGNAVRALVESPDVLARLRADPGLRSPLIEETLRWDSPVQYLFRRTLQEIEIAGTTIPENAFVVLLLGSANRDEAHWGAEAAQFDLDRNPVGHLGLGVGAHFCLGAALARMEAECALEQLLPLIGASRFAGHALEPIDSIQFRGVRKLQFRTEAA